MTDLPAGLRAAIDRLLDGVSRQSLAARAKAISNAYREGSASAGVVRDPLDVAAYLTARLPATFAAVAAALRQADKGLPEFSPRSLIDVGCGPGTASFAAAERWGTLETATLIDANPVFLATAKALCTEGPAALCAANFVRSAALPALARAAPVDLVLAAYILVEVPEMEIRAYAEALWQRSGDLLVFVEPGTPEGFRRIRIVRDVLLGNGAHIVAPCPHSGRCPVEAPDWCHFSQRLVRSRDHMRAKGADVPFEDERFSYLVLSRSAAPRRAAARIVGPARLTKIGWSARVCGAEGLAERHVSRREGDFASVRRLEWGDGFEAAENGRDPSV